MRADEFFFFESFEEVEEVEKFEVESRGDVGVPIEIVQETFGSFHNTHVHTLEHFHLEGGRVRGDGRKTRLVLEEEWMVKRWIRYVLGEE